MPRPLITLAAAALLAGAAAAQPAPGPEVLPPTAVTIASADERFLDAFPEPPGAVPARPVLDRLRGRSGGDRPEPPRLRPGPGAAHPGPFDLAFPDPADPGPGAGWATAEFLLWKLSPQRLPPLVTATPRGAPASAAGVLGTPGTTILADNDDLDGPRAGLRLSAGLWLDAARGSAVEMSVFALDTKSSDRDFASAGRPGLARPFFAAGAGAAARLIAFQTPDVGGFRPALAGRVAVGTDSDLWGFEVNYRRPVGGDTETWFDAVAGYRLLHLSDTLTIADQRTVVAAVPAGGLAPGTRVDTYDRFRTRNTFNGAQAGVIAHLAADCLAVTGFAKLAVGHLYQVTDVYGATTTLAAGGTPVVSPGGLLAGPGNAGQRGHSRLACIPEVGFTVGYQATEWMRVTAGYNVLGLCNFVRAGDQIDGTVGDGRPRPIRNETNVCVQGATLGLEFGW